MSLAAPLTAFIRVPLSWYRSTTFAFLPDESSATIHRVYTHPSEQHSKRHFCGFCGTPLSYWSEQPRSEAEYIQLTLGSLSSEDLGDLEDLGLIPDPEESPSPTRHGASTPEEKSPAGRETLNVPWFDSMIAGSRLGNMRTSKGSHQSLDGRVKVEWEVMEWTGDDVDSPGPAKRARQDTAEADTAREMEGIQR